MEYELLQSLLIALAIGFMIGLQRALSNMLKNEPVIMGSRTFALIALSGYVAAYLSQEYEWIVAAAFLGVVAVSTLAYYSKVALYKKSGVTTQVSALVTFLLGVMVYEGHEAFAITIATIIIALLELKSRLQKFERHISPTDINSVVLLLVMTFVILPILPDRFIDPYGLFNPYKTWLMAVVIASISFIGYIAVKVFGHKHGLFLTGAAGGLISSTAVTITLSKMYANQRRLVEAFTAGIAIACTFMFLRVLLEAFVVNPDLAAKLSVPYLAASFVGLLYVYVLYKKIKEPNIEIKDETLSKNPLQLSEAIKFGLLFGIIYGAIKVVEHRYGDIGVYVISFLSGITDVDAITLSLSEMAKKSLSPHAAMAGIVIASVTNSLVKLAIAFYLGGATLGKRLSLFFALTLGVMIAGLLLVTRGAI
ncbi:MAG: MgtC/SapB family protein [Epsilonproteobacteria bacterium]|nr:MgtC/SapB family protein [Campylobacterota bacterium]NPA64088.1 MgtC/SapB family protein [Campylobacterota bacterium]